MTGSLTMPGTMMDCLWKSQPTKRDTRGWRARGSWDCQWHNPKQWQSQLIAANSGDRDHYSDTESDSDGREREWRWWYGDRWWQQHRDKARQRQMQQSRRCELCVLAATVPDCSRQLKLQFAVCTVADFLSISFRLQSSKRVMSSNVIFEPQLVIVVHLSCWSTASWRASHTEPRTGGELVHEPLRVRLQSGGNFLASIWFISCLSQSMAKKKSL